MKIYQERLPGKPALMTAITLNDSGSMNRSAFPRWESGCQANGAVRPVSLISPLITTTDSEICLKQNNKFITRPRLLCKDAHDD